MSTPSGRPSNSLHQAVGELSGKVDTILVTILPAIQDLRLQTNQLDQRVGTLEVWQGRILGGAGVVGFLITTYEVWQHVIPKR